MKGSNSMRGRGRKGFSLIELVVVVMILGILAAIAAPRLFNTSAVATDNSVKQSLYVIRDAIELFKSENDGALPGQSNDLPGDLAPYLRGKAFPKCPVGTEDSLVTYGTGTPIAADASPTTSWKFYTDSGEFIINSGSATASDPAVNYDDL